jgi:cell division protein FtsW
VVNSLYAISSGGWWGTGIGASGQKWGRLPEAHTDFIFAVVAEELGLFGSLFVLVLFLVLAYGGIRVALAASTTFGRLAVVGVMAWILIQAFINIGGVLSVLPITGVPLPLVSSGGSAMIITLIGLGVVLAVARQEPAARALLGHRRRRRRVA